MSNTRTLCCGILKILLYSVFGIAIPIACLVFAVKYEGQCPAEDKIIIYLYVSGAFCMIRGVHAIVFTLMLLCGCCRSKKGLCVPLVIDITLGVFLFAWFIAGSVWVYKLKDKYSSDPEDPMYCNDALYKFSFAILTTQWVLNALSMVLSAVGQCCERD